MWLPNHVAQMEVLVPALEEEDVDEAKRMASIVRKDIVNLLLSDLLESEAGDEATAKLDALSDAFDGFISAASAELDAPRILACPSDTATLSAVTDWKSFAAGTNQNKALSYFTGLDAYEEVPQAFVAGDRNISGGGRDKCNSVSVAGVWAQELKAGNTKIIWTNNPVIHRRLGNIALTDGSVQWSNKRALTNLVNEAAKGLLASDIRNQKGSRISNHVLLPR